MDSELQTHLDIEAIIYDKRPELVQTYLDDVEAARKWADHEDKTGACLRGITAVEDPNFDIWEAPDGQ